MTVNNVNLFAAAVGAGCVGLQVSWVGPFPRPALRRQRFELWPRLALAVVRDIGLREGNPFLTVLVLSYILETRETDTFPRAKSWSQRSGT